MDIALINKNFLPVKFDYFTNLAMTKISNA